MQDLFHLAGHWLQATGVWKHHLDPYMNRLPLFPLPKQRAADSSLMMVQLIMLWLLWAVGVTIAVLTFLVELMTGGKVKRHKVVLVRKNQWLEAKIVENNERVQGKLEPPALNVPVKRESGPGKRNEDSKPTNGMKYNEYDDNAMKAFEFE